MNEIRGWGVERLVFWCVMENGSLIKLWNNNGKLIKFIDSFMFELLLFIFVE